MTNLPRGEGLCFLLHVFLPFFFLLPGAIIIAATITCFLRPLAHSIGSLTRFAVWHAQPQVLGLGVFHWTLTTSSVSQHFALSGPQERDKWIALSLKGWIWCVTFVFVGFYFSTVFLHLSPHTVPHKLQHMPASFDPVPVCKASCSWSPGHWGFSWWSWTSCQSCELFWKT